MEPEEERKTARFSIADGPAPIDSAIYGVWERDLAGELISRDFIPMGETLLACGWDPKLNNWQGDRSPFALALACRSEKFAFWLLDRSDQHPDEAADGSALSYALMVSGAAARELVRRGASLTSALPHGYNSTRTPALPPLLLARAMGDLRRAQLLIELGAPASGLRRPDPVSEPQEDLEFHAAKDSIATDAFHAAYSWDVAPDEEFDALLRAHLDRAALGEEMSSVADDARSPEATPAHAPNAGNAENTISGAQKALRRL